MFHSAGQDEQALNQELLQDATEENYEEEEYVPEEPEEVELSLEEYKAQLVSSSEVQVVTNYQRSI
jgi:hypothetical protein